MIAAMEAGTRLEQVSLALKQGAYSIKKNQPLNTDGLALEELGDIDSKDYTVEIMAAGLTAIITALTVYFEKAAGADGRMKTVISDTEFDDDELVFFDEEGIGICQITDRECIEAVKQNIRQKLLN